MFIIIILMILKDFSLKYKQKLQDKCDIYIEIIYYIRTFSLNLGWYSSNFKYGISDIYIEIIIFYRE